MSKRSKTLMLVGGSIIGVGALAYLLINLKGGEGDGVIKEVYLTIEVGAGGTTNPSPNTYAYSPGAIEFITAIPNDGYRVEGWVINGVTDFGTAGTIPVNLTEDTTVQVTFTTEPLPPPQAFPTSMKNLTAEPPATISIKQPIEGYWTSDDVARTQHYNVIPVMNYGDKEYAWVSKTVEFQVWDDILNVPVPNINCRLYAGPKDILGGGLGKAIYSRTLGKWNLIYYQTHPLNAISNGSGKIMLTFNYLIENPSYLSQEHIAYGRHYTLSIAGYCLKDGDTFPYCNFLANGCLSENTVTTAVSCPDCVPNCLNMGEQEYANFHIITCEVADNSTIKAICNVNCYVGIKHTP